MVNRFVKLVDILELLEGMNYSVVPKDDIGPDMDDLEKAALHFEEWNEGGRYELMVRTLSEIGRRRGQLSGEALLPTGDNLLDKKLLTGELIAVPRRPTDLQLRALIRHRGLDPDAVTDDYLDNFEVMTMGAYTRAYTAMVEALAGAPYNPWRPINTAPKDGSRILIAKFGYVTDTQGKSINSAEWRDLMLDPNSPKKWTLWWVTSGYWEAKYNNWNDGVEPSGLALPTHWMHIPPAPETTSLIKPLAPEPKS